MAGGKVICLRSVYSVVLDSPLIVPTPPTTILCVPTIPTPCPVILCTTVPCKIKHSLLVVLFQVRFIVWDFTSLTLTSKFSFCVTFYSPVLSFSLLCRSGLVGLGVGKTAHMLRSAGWWPMQSAQIRLSSLQQQLFWPCTCSALVLQLSFVDRQSVV